jgi:hypothetical protein
MLITNLNKVRELSEKDRGLLLQSLLLLPAIHAALIVLGYARLQQLMEWLTPLQSNPHALSEREILPYAREISRIVSIAAAHGVYRATCLRKSMLVWWFLRREGIQSRICFGVRMTGRLLLAHAWLEWDGIVLNDSIDISEQYKALRDGLPGTTMGL